MNRSIVGSLDFGLLIPALFLCIISLVTLSSLSGTLFKSQLLYIFISFLVFFLFSQLRFQILQSHSFPLYLVSLLLLFIVLVIGLESHGALRWIDIFGIRIQFSEICKPFLAVSFSSFLSKQNQGAMSLFFLSLFLFPVVFFIYKQPDLGNAIVFLLVAFATLIVSGIPYRLFGAFVFIFVLVLPFASRFLHGYQKERLVTFFNPTSDPLGTSYNAIQAIIAVGSGMFLGKGIGAGTQSTLRFLPERQTDFIFATYSEAFGFVGSVFLLACFCFLLYRIYQIFVSTQGKGEKLFCACAFFTILLQAFVNIGMNLGLVPIVGITLPFVSYGGSSLLSNFIFLGMLSSISSIKHTKQTIEIR